MTDIIDRDRLIAEASHAAGELIDRLDLTFDPAHTPETPNGNAGMPNALLVWEGGDEIGGDGYDFLDAHTDAIGRLPDPNYGEWPYLMEWFWVYDPKDNPPSGDDTMERLFLTLRLCRIEGEVYLGFYLSVADARADATPHGD